MPSSVGDAERRGEVNTGIDGDASVKVCQRMQRVDLVGELDDCAVIMVFGSAFQFGWLPLRSNSVWPCALLHGSHNLFFQRIFDGMTAQEGSSLYLTTEFGTGLAITAAITAFVLWRHPIRPTNQAVFLDAKPIGWIV